VQAIALFNEFELEQLLCGLKEINVDDWKQHSVRRITHYYLPTIHFASYALWSLSLVSFSLSLVSQVMLGLRNKDFQSDWFWTILSAYTNEQRGLLMQFTTGSAQVYPSAFLKKKLYFIVHSLYLFILLLT
jgi:hypothetical protein